MNRWAIIGASLAGLLAAGKLRRVQGMHRRPTDESVGYCRGVPGGTARGGILG
ncbi:MAG: hypothetical protein R3B96_13755 [Pirellulaceae bacterium]